MAADTIHPDAPYQELWSSGPRTRGNERPASQLPKRGEGVAYLGDGADAGLGTLAEAGGKFARIRTSGGEKTLDGSDLAGHGGGPLELLLRASGP